MNELCYPLYIALFLIESIKKESVTIQNLNECVPQLVTLMEDDNFPADVITKFKELDRDLVTDIKYVNSCINELKEQNLIVTASASDFFISKVISVEEMEKKHKLFVEQFICLSSDEAKLSDRGSIISSLLNIYPLKKPASSGRRISISYEDDVLVDRLIKLTSSKTVAAEHRDPVSSRPHRKSAKSARIKINYFFLLEGDKKVLTSSSRLKKDKLSFSTSCPAAKSWTP